MINKQHINFTSAENFHKTFIFNYFFNRTAFRIFFLWSKILQLDFLDEGKKPIFDREELKLNESTIEKKGVPSVRIIDVESGVKLEWKF